MKLDDAKRIVIKIGTSLVTNDGTAHHDWIASIAEDIAHLKSRGKQVLIVSSGALALGRPVLGKTIQDHLKIEEKQAAAACGQSELIQLYRKHFREQHTDVAQILLSLDDTENRRRYLNARNTIETLLANNIVPIINENDSIATLEIRFGDNDRLAARVAQMVEADLLILLSDVDGLYNTNPKKHDTAEHIPEIKTITDDIEAMAGKPDSNFSSGGMITKLLAAKIAISSGCHMIIALGKNNHPLQDLENGGRHTLFLAEDTPHNARKRWIVHNLKILGEIIIDAGAANALKDGKSLLPVGVKTIHGSFDRGDCVIIKDESGKELGRGLSAYSSNDASQIIGHNSSEIEEILHFTGRDALIHRDDLVLH